MVFGTKYEATRESFHMKTILELHGKEVWRHARNVSSHKRKQITSSNVYFTHFTSQLESEIASYKVIDVNTVTALTDIELSRSLRDHCDWTTTLERVQWHGEGPAAKQLVWHPPGSDPKWDTRNSGASYSGMGAVRYYIKKGELSIDCRSKLVEWRNIIMDEMVKLEDPVIAL